MWVSPSPARGSQSSLVEFVLYMLRCSVFIWTKAISLSECSHRECQHHDIKILGKMANFGMYIRHACILSHCI